jgi:hypothetical protein
VKYNPITRRMFLQGASATLAIPFLPSIVNAQSVAQDTFFFFLPFNQGVPRSKFWPLNKTVAFAQTEANTKIRALSEIIAANGKISDLLDASWNVHASKINIMTHLNLFGSTWDHRPLGPGCASTNYDMPNYSLDHCIRESWLKKGYKPKLPFLSVNIGRTFTSGDYWAFSWGVNGGKDYPVIDNIQKLELAIMGSAPAPGGAVTSQQKLVDAVLGDYQRLLNDRRISSLDKTRLTDAMDQWNDIQNNSRSGACAMPASVGATTNFGVQNRQAVDLITAAMSCGLIRAKPWFALLTTTSAGWQCTIWHTGPVHTWTVSNGNLV